MKKRFIILLLIVAIFALPLAACGGEKKAPTTKKLDVADYAVDVNMTIGDQEMFPDSALYTTAAKYDKTVVSGNNFGVIVSENADGKYTLVDENSGAALLNGKTFTNVTFDSYPFIKIYDTEDAVSKQGLLDHKGNVLVDLTELNGSISVDSFSNLYVEGEYKTAYILTVSYTPKDAQDPVKKYYKVDYTEAAEMQLTEVAEDKLRTTSQDNNVGAVASSLSRRYVYSFTMPVGNEYPEMDEYNYSRNVIDTDGTYSKILYTFYKGSEKSGELIVENGFTVGFVKNYLYFAEVEKLPYDATSGYNVYRQSGDITTVSKMKYTYYRYNVLKNKVSKYDPGYCIMPNSLTGIYNYKDKTVDAAIVASAVNYVDGVAVISSQTKEKTYVVDSDLKVGADVSNKPFDVSKGLILLKDNRLLAASDNEFFIVDNDLNEIASVATNSYQIYKNSQLIVCGMNGQYMAIDFDGKVVMEPKYSSLTFYGGYALTNITETDGTVKNNYLVSKDNIAGLALDSIGNLTDSLIYNSDGIFVKLDEQNKATVYNYAGTAITSIEDVSSVRKALTTDGKLYLTVTTASQYSVSTYVLS